MGRSKPSDGSDIPEEVIMLILLWLPAKTLVRFMSVSRSWRALISDPAFVSSHMNHSAKHDDSRTLLIWEQLDQNIALWKRDQPFDQRCLHIHCPASGEFHDQEYEGLRMAGSCNGLICLFDMRYSYLWNPNIRKLRRIPIISCSSNSKKQQWRKIAGLGFDEVANDYKVVSIEEYVGDTDYSFHRRAWVYWLKCGTWKRVQYPNVGFCLSVPYQALVNGVIHWILKKYDEAEHGDVNEFSILTFDVRDEVFGRMMLPQPAARFRECFVSVVDGLLASIQERRNGEWSVWVMNEYQNAQSWSLIFKTNMGLGEVVIGLRTKEEILCTSYNLDNKKRIRLLSAVTGSNEYIVLGEYPAPCGRQLSLAYAYVDSLVLL